MNAPRISGVAPLHRLRYGSGRGARQEGRVARDRQAGPHGAVGPPLSAGGIVLRYAAFAALATLANLGAQRGVLWLTPASLGIAPAMAVGTGVGLVVKYLLDKRWIFGDRSAGLAAHGRRFTRYTLTGVLTTLIFWGAEAGAWALWHTDLAREAGALAGLTLGYVLKYRLDRAYVFDAGR